jgi:hypothetical protein
MSGTLMVVLGCGDSAAVLLQQPATSTCNVLRRHVVDLPTRSKQCRWLESLEVERVSSIAALFNCCPCQFALQLGTCCVPQLPSSSILLDYHSLSDQGRRIVDSKHSCCAETPVKEFALHVI